MHQITIYRLGKRGIRHGRENRDNAGRALGRRSNEASFPLSDLLYLPCDFVTTRYIWWHLGA